MAAVLCKLFCVEPCRACGNCLKACGSAVRPCCRCVFECCGAIAQCCNDCNSMFTEPLSCLLFLAFMTIGFVGTFGAIGFTKDLDQCKGDMKIWFIIALVECGGHILYALYGFFKVKNRDRAKENFYMALYELLVHDKWTALYIIFDIFGLVWSFMGLNWNKHCSEPVFGTVVAVGLILWISWSYFIMIFQLFYESLDNILCFFCLCFPYMLAPCCFSVALRRSYERQAIEYRNQNMPPSNNFAAHQHNQVVIQPRGNEVHPVPPQVNQEEGSAIINVAGNVGSYLWNKAVKSNNQSTATNNGDATRIGRV